MRRMIAMLYTRSKRFMMRFLIKWAGFQGRRHKIRDEAVIRWMHDNGIGA